MVRPGATRNADEAVICDGLGSEVQAGLEVELVDRGVRSLTMMLRGCSFGTGVIRARAKTGTAVYATLSYLARKESR